MHTARKREGCILCVLWSWQAHHKFTWPSLPPDATPTPAQVAAGEDSAQISSYSRWRIGLQDSRHKQQHSCGSSSARNKTQLTSSVPCTWNELHSVDPGMVPLQRMHQPSAAGAAPRSVQAQPPAVPLRPAAGQIWDARQAWLLCYQ